MRVCVLVYWSTNYIYLAQGVPWACKMAQGSPAPGPCPHPSKSRDYWSQLTRFWQRGYRDGLITILFVRTRSDVCFITSARSLLFVPENFYLMMRFRTSAHAGLAVSPVNPTLALYIAQFYHVITRSLQNGRLPDFVSAYYQTWPRGYKTFVMLILTEHEIFPAHIC